jgi:hypothetical protein
MEEKADGAWVYVYSGQEELLEALKNFQAILSPELRAQLNKNPSASDIVELTENIDAKKPKGSRRILAFLQSFQQFSTVVDTFIQSNPLVSALVWGSVKFLILV